ncbi:hypothetical protein PENTCL1PPCAC_17104, partial [Pristionchus entomophagus]
QKFLVDYVYYAQNSVTVLMTFDRFLAVCHTREFENWQRWVPLYALLMFSATFSLHFLLYFDKANVGSRFVYNSILDCYSLSTNSYQIHNKSILWQATVGTICLLVCAGLNVRTLIRLRRLYVANKRIEISFLAISLFTFLAQTANVIV